MSKNAIDFVFYVDELYEENEIPITVIDIRLHVI